MRLKFYIFALLILFGCQDPQASHVDGFPNETRIWETLNIPVCWEHPEARPADELRWVEEALADSWERWSQVRFTGWGTCTDSDRNGIRVVLADEWPRSLGLGSAIRGVDQGVLLNHSFQNWGQGCARSEDQRKFCVRGIAVHEFGHALGFAHEHNRDDREPECLSESQGSSGTTKIGVWDVNSVMNYCSPIYNNNAQLSKTDIVTVQYYYGRPHEALLTSGPDLQDGTSTWTRWVLNLDRAETAKVDENFKVLVNIDHPNPTELSIYLQGPDASWYSLHNQTAGNGNGLHGVYPDTLRPASDLAQAQGKPLAGQWSLWVRDSIPGNQGRINRFGISDYLPEAYLLSFTPGRLSIKPNVSYEHSLISKDPLPLNVSAEELARHISLQDSQGLPVPVQAIWDRGHIRLRMEPRDLLPETAYTLTVSGGRLSGLYTIDKDYRLRFTTPKPSAVPPVGGFWAEQVSDLEIPDGSRQGIRSMLTLTAPPAFKVSAQFRVRLQLEHAYSGDLKIVLTSPKGTEVILHLEQGSSETGFNGYFPGQYQPYESFSKIRGETLGGDWTLTVIDAASGDQGILKAWRIEDSIN